MGNEPEPSTLYIVHGLLSARLRELAWSSPMKQSCCGSHSGSPQALAMSERAGVVIVPLLEGVPGYFASTSGWKSAVWAVWDRPRTGWRGGYPCPLR